MGMWYFVIGVVALVVGISVAIAVRKNRTDRLGAQGEKAVARVLKRLCGKNGELFNDYMMKGERTSVQIDHILIDEYGVFVIETKNYSGIIYGDDVREEWTQILADGKVKNSFHSPVKQNAGHLYHVKKALDRDVPVYGIVVFVQNNTQNIKAQSVVGLKGLKKAVKAYRTQPALTPADIKRVCETLEDCRDTETSAKQHVKDVEEMIEGVKSNTVCPRCGGKLVEREGMYGKFIGCENYPKCNFTKKCD